MASFFPAVLLAAVMPLMAQDATNNMPNMDMNNMKDMKGMNMKDMNMKDMNMKDMNMGSMSDMNMKGMVERHIGRWTLMMHGIAFVTDTQQTGPVGGDKFYSISWFMVEASHSLAGGTFTVRSMFSLDPATITERQYPELF